MATKTYEEWISLAKSYEKEALDESTDHEEEEGLFRQASQAYARAASLNPTSVEALFDWGRVAVILSTYTDEDNLEERASHLSVAIQKLRESIKLDPAHGPATYHLAQALIADGDLKVEQADEESQEDEAAADALMETAKAQIKEALGLFDKTVEIQRAQIAAGEPKGDPVTVDNVVDTILNSVEGLCNLAHVEDNPSLFEGYYQQAIAKLEQAMTENPERKGEVLQEWAAVLERQLDKINQNSDFPVTDYSAPLAKLEESIAADPKRADPHCDKGDMLLTSAHSYLLSKAFAGTNMDDIDDDDEEQPHDLIAKLKPEDQEKVWQLYGDAIEAFKAASSLEPDATGILQRLGDIHIIRANINIEQAKQARTELYSGAEAAYRAAIAKDAEDEELVIRLAQVLFLQGGHDSEVTSLLAKYRELGGTLSDVLDEEDDVFQEEFVAKLSSEFPEEAWETDSDDE